MVNGALRDGDARDVIDPTPVDILKNVLEMFLPVGGIGMNEAVLNIVGERRDRCAFARYLRTGRHLQVTIAPPTVAIETKFNPNHDSRNGQFTFGPGGSGSLATWMRSGRMRIIPKAAPGRGAQRWGISTRAGGGPASPGSRGIGTAKRHKRQHRVIPGSDDAGAGVPRIARCARRIDPGPGG